MGEWETPYLTMAPQYQATIVRQLAAFAEKGLVYKAKKSVHWCISCQTALAEAEVEYDDNHQSPSIDVRFPLAEAERAGIEARFPALRGKKLFAVIWTTTPWTLPANLALAFHPEADYACYPVEGTSDVLVLAKALREAAEARFWGATDKPKRLGEPLAEAKGADFEHLRFRHLEGRLQVRLVAGKHARHRPCHPPRAERPVAHRFEGLAARPVAHEDERLRALEVHLVHALGAALADHVPHAHHQGHGHALPRVLEVHHLPRHLRPDRHDVAVVEAVDHEAAHERGFPHAGLADEEDLLLEFEDFHRFQNRSAREI